MTIGKKRLKWQRFEELELRIAQLQKVHVFSRLYIHQRNESGVPCPCCGSLDAFAYVVRDDINLLIDPRKQTRLLRHNAKNTTAFDKIAYDKDTKQVEIKFTLRDDETATILTDDESSVIGVSGSARAGKSRLGLCWLVRAWMLHGGRGASFWLVGPTMNYSWLLACKLISGEQGKEGWRPPTLPLDEENKSPLVLSSPRSEQHARTSPIKMIDGSLIELKYASEKALRGQAVQRILYTEAAKTQEPDAYKQMLGRIAMASGQVYIDSSPVHPDHWLQTEVQRLAYEQEANLAVDSKTRVTHRWHHLTAKHNPWMSENEYETWSISMGDPNDPNYLREVLGIAADYNAKLWAPLWTQETKAKYITFAPSPGVIPSDRGHDITRQVSLSIGFKRGHQWLAGQDVNFDPMSTVICKVFGEFHDPTTWTLYVEKLFMGHGRVYVDQHAKNLKTTYGGRYADTGIVVDATSCNSNSHAGGSNRYSSDAQAFIANGFEILPPQGTLTSKPTNPNIEDSVRCCTHLMYVEKLLLDNTTTTPLQNAFDQQIRAGAANKAYKPPGSKWDKLSGPADAFRYITWRIFGKVYVPPQNNFFIRR